MMENATFADLVDVVAVSMSDIAHNQFDGAVRAEHVLAPDGTGTQHRIVLGDDNPDPCPDEWAMTVALGPEVEGHALWRCTPDDTGVEILCSAVPRLLMGLLAY